MVEFRFYSKCSELKRMTVVQQQFRDTNNTEKVTFEAVKNNCEIEISLILNMQSYSVDQKSKVEYELVAACVHDGNSLNSGHYRGICKSIDGEWFNFDDDSVFKVDDLKSELQGAYLLFYKKLTSSTEDEVVKKDGDQDENIIDLTNSEEN